MTEKDDKKTVDNGKVAEKDYDPTVIGKGKPGPGRPKGCPNKTTKDKREWVSKLLEDREDLIEEALDTLAKEDPDKALKHLLGLMEYTTPKLARSEIVGKDDGPVEVHFVKRLIDPEAEDSEDES